MLNTFNRLFDLREGEAGVVIIMSFLLLANTLSRQMSGIVGIADLIGLGGINETLIVNTINGVLIIVTATLASFIVDRYNRIQLLRWTSFTFALAFVVLAMTRFLNVSPKLIAALLYLLSQQQWLIFPMIFWVLANDMFEVAQGKRLIPAIGSWSFVGKVIGTGAILLPGALAQLGVMNDSSLTMDMVLLTNIFVYLLAFLLITVGLGHIKLRQTAQQQQNVRETLSEGWGFVKEVPSFRYLLLAVMGIGICDIIVEFRFFVVAKASIPDVATYKEFYAYYLLAAAVISFFFQGFVAGRILKKFQLKNVFLIQPFMALASTVAMLVSVGLPVNVISSLLLKISRNTIDESTGKSFQALIPEERRGRVSLFMNNYVPAIGYILGSLLTAIVVYTGLALGNANVFYIYLGISAVAALSAIGAIFWARKHYDDSLFNWRLKRRKRGVDVLNKLEF